MYPVLSEAVSWTRARARLLPTACWIQLCPLTLVSRITVCLPQWTPLCPLTHSSSNSRKDLPHQVTGFNAFLFLPDFLEEPSTLTAHNIYYLYSFIGPLQSDIWADAWEAGPGKTSFLIALLCFMEPQAPSDICATPSASPCLALCSFPSTSLKTPQWSLLLPPLFVLQMGIRSPWLSVLRVTALKRRAVLCVQGYLSKERCAVFITDSRKIPVPQGLPSSPSPHSAHSESVAITQGRLLAQPQVSGPGPGSRFLYWTKKALGHRTLTVLRAGSVLAALNLLFSLFLDLGGNIARQFHIARPLFSPSLLS